MSEWKLNYPLAHTPEPGTHTEVISGVHWLRLPLPIQLHHINVWLLSDGDGWTLVDTGMNVDTCLAAWTEFADALFFDKPLKRIIVTHYHPDHVGLAGYLAERFEARLCMTEMSYKRTCFLCDSESEDWQSQVALFCKLHGIANEERYTEFIVGKEYRKVISTLPVKVDFLDHNIEIEIDGCYWQPIVASGHAEDHLSLYSAEKNLLISGDQVLPEITSNIGVHFNNAGDNALEQYLTSLELFDALPEDVMVLPSHGRVFTGLHKRTAYIREKHSSRLQNLWELCKTPQNVTQLIPQLFGKNDLDGFNQALAFGEILAHLVYLNNQGKLIKHIKNETCYFAQA